MQNRNFYLYIGGQPVPVSEEVYQEYRRAEDKERYFMCRLKKGHTKIDPDTQEIHYIPAGNCLMNSLWSGTGSLPRRMTRWRKGWPGRNWQESCGPSCAACPRRKWRFWKNCFIWKRRSGKWQGCMPSHRTPSTTGKTGFWTS